MQKEKFVGYPIEDFRPFSERFIFPGDAWRYVGTKTVYIRQTDGTDKEVDQK